MSDKIDELKNEIIPLLNNFKENINKIYPNIGCDPHGEKFTNWQEMTNLLSKLIPNIDANHLPDNSLNDLKCHLIELNNNLNSNHDSNHINQCIESIGNSIENLLEFILPSSLYKKEVDKTPEPELLEAYYIIAKNKLLKIKSTQEDIETIISAIQKEQDEFQIIKKELEDYKDQLFSQDGTKGEIEKLLTNLRSKLSRIEKQYKSIYGEDGSSDKIQDLLDTSSSKLSEINNFHKSAHEKSQEIETLHSAISDKNNEVTSLRDGCSEIIQKLNNFHDKIFGSNKNGEKVGGLEQEIEQRKSDLDELEQKQQEGYDELIKKIENLLPGATSAGLSSAYNEMRNKFSKSAKYYGIGFYASLAILFIIISLVKDVALVKEIPLDKGILISLLILFGNISVKMPFIIPALWLVVFLSRRRSEAERLSQEYAHKEVLAKSYDSYKKQIEKLSQEDQEKLLPILMENMIKAISLNPAKTLEKIHQSDNPISEILKDKNMIDELKKLITKDN